MTKAYPLQWPHGRARSKTRSDSLFKVKPAQAFEEMIEELNRFGAKGVVVSSNIPTRRDGTPYRDGLNELLDDPGVAVFFTKRTRLVCLPCDSYRRPWENCRAIGKAVEALRSMDRHGAHQILDQAFDGFTALPAPGATSDAPSAAWWVVLDVPLDASPDQIRRAYKDKCREAGGATVDLNRARSEGLAASGFK